MMGHRLGELEMRRRALLLKSARLRSEFGADQHYVLQTLEGVDRYWSIARSVAKPVAMAGAGLLLMRFLRRGRSAAGGASFAMRALMWVSMARRLLPLVGLARAFMRSRQRPASEAESESL